MLRRIYKFIFFRIFGWSIEGELPSVKKYVLIVAPHTSNWDFLVGVFTRRILQFDPRFVGKKELFTFPLGYFFKWMGGYPVDRSGGTNFVQSMVEIFEKEDEFILTMTPEGTRKYTGEWKSGYYYVAKAANVPVLPVAFDFENKRVVLGELDYLEDDLESNTKKYLKYFSQFKGRNPEGGVKWQE